MSKRYKNTFRDKVKKRIESLPGAVILWKDLNDLGSSRQISRALNDCIQDKFIVRIGRGIYAKAKETIYIDIPIVTVGFEQACIEALERLNIDWELPQAVKDYNEGRTQQVPAWFEVKLNTRFRRRLSYGKRAMRVEGSINAR